MCPNRAPPRQSISDLARDSSAISVLPPLSRPNLEEAFRAVSPLVLQPKEFNEKITVAVKKFITALGLPQDNSYGIAVDEFQSRVVGLGGTLTTEEVLIPNTSLSTFRLLTSDLSPDQVKSNAISTPLRNFEFLRSVIEDIMRIQVDQSHRLQSGLSTLTTARASMDAKERKVIVALDERIKLLQGAVEDYVKTLTVIREMMRLTHEKLAIAPNPRSSMRVVLNM